MSLARDAMVLSGYRGVGQDMPAIMPDQPTNADPDVLAYDPSLPFDRGGAVINHGCPDGYFAQVMPSGDPTSVFVQIPGVVQGSYLRCRKMATTTQQTIADESGQTAAQSWYNYTNTGIGAWFGDWLSKLSTLEKYAVIGGVVYAGAMIVGAFKGRR